MEGEGFALKSLRVKWLLSLWVSEEWSMEPATRVALSVPEVGTRTIDPGKLVVCLTTARKEGMASQPRAV